MNTDSPKTDCTGQHLRGVPYPKPRSLLPSRHDASQHPAVTAALPLENLGPAFPTCMLTDSSILNVS